jgi:hypothetical protein
LQVQEGGLKGWLEWIMANLRKYSPLVNWKETEAEPDGKIEKKKKHRNIESQQLAVGGNGGRRYSHRM